MSNFNKQVGKNIDKSKSDKLKANWKKTKILTQSSFIGSDILIELLNKPGAVGLRIYYGIDDEGSMQPVFYACNADGNPITSTSPDAKTASTESDGGADASVPCPPICGNP